MRAAPRVALVLVALAAVLVAGECPTFSTEPLPKCPQRSDHELCILAAHRDADRLADFEFINTKAIKDADPLACKLRMAAIRQHILYHGEHGHGSTDCKRAAAIFKTNSLSNIRISDVCEQIGFPKCGAYCHHGGRVQKNDDGSCQCECADGWSGPECTECGMMPMECLHEGTLQNTNDQCGCECKYPWSGVHCDQCNRNCKHSGFSDPTDPRCECQCPFPWIGDECTECSLKCQHAGRLLSNYGKCECECSPLAEGPQCEQCSARCLNGGVLDKDTCTCKCPGGFTGHQCEICDVKCQHSGTFVPNECRCECGNPWTSGQQCENCANTCHGRGREVDCLCVDCEGYWRGSSCNNCTLRCVNQGELDHRSCKCACDPSQCVHGQSKDDCSCECSGYWRGETCEQCDLNCVHGTLDPTTCTCKCDSFFSGDKCDMCTHNCTGRGTLNTATCQCTDCIAPFHGFDCQMKCNKTCLHGSRMNAEKCTCEQCPLPWLGSECNVCKLTLNRTSTAGVCGIHGRLNAAECRCECEEGWGGERCHECVRVCAHGRLDSNTCACECESHWTGVNCTDCFLTCQNGGVLDKHQCFCECDHMHSGSSCQGGACHMTQSCDSCLSVSDGCEWCGKTSSCTKKPGPGALSTCVGPVKQGLCPTYGDCHMCDYTPSELAWLAMHGEASTGRGSDPSMPEPLNGQDAVVCNAEKGETWCKLRRLCVQDWVGGENGPCEIPVPTETVKSLNGFVGM